MASSNIEMIRKVAVGLGDLKDSVVFIGGAVTELYANDPASTEIRPTLDVDCVIELASRGSFYHMEDSLRRKGFKNDTTPGAPICRWIYKDVIVDIMPDDEDILGFSNRWYKAGVKNRIEKEIDNNLKIFIFQVHYYLATKLEATFHRGMADLRTSQDFEDVVYILNNNLRLVEIITECHDKELKQYLKDRMKSLLNLKYINEAIECCLPYGDHTRLRIIIDLMNKI
ncbi:MAG: hypothetical protein Q8S23_08265 [Bacteroidales bacterium]|jgi:hypothetical protein|nr:hypothetical protein [Bacteroidales bacterium]